MAIDIIKEVNRLAGFAVLAGQDLVSGQPVLLSDPNTIRSYNNASVDVLGLALDDTKQFVLANVPTTLAQSGTTRVLYDRPTGDLTPQSLFFSDINRGGLVSVATDGGVFGLLDDGRGSPYEVSPTAPYAINAPLYADPAAGLITSDSAGAVKVGTCVKTPAGDGKLVMSMRLA